MERELVERLEWLQERFEIGEQSDRFLARQELQGRLPDIIAALSVQPEGDK